MAPAPGLQHVQGIVDGDPLTDSLDALVDLVAELQSNLANPSHILLDPLGWAEFRKLKMATDSNASLIGAGTNDAQAMLLSPPVIVNNALPAFPGIAALAHTARNPRAPIGRRRRVAKLIVIRLSLESRGKLPYRVAARASANV